MTFGCFFQLNGSDQDAHGLPNISRLKSGEQLNSDLQFLTEQGLASIVELTAQHADQNMLPQIQQHFDSMIANGDYLYPDIHVVAMDLPLNAESRESRVAFSKLTFRVLKVGNLWGSRPSLTVDKSLIYSSFTYDALKTRFHRPVMKHPMDSTINGVLYLCELPSFCSGFALHLVIIINPFLIGPRGKQQLIGPIDENRAAMHHCFTDYILAHLEKSSFMVDLEDELAALSTEEREQTWKQEYPHPCRTTCPGSTTHLSHLEEDASDDDHVITNAVLGTQTHQTTRLSATTVTPLLSNLDVERTVMSPPLWLQDTPSPSLPPLTLPEVPIEPTEYSHEESSGHAYNRFDRPRFVNFQMFEITINQTRIPAILANDKSFSLTAGSVPAAAKGLVNALKGVKRNQLAQLAPYEAINGDEPDREFYLTEPSDVTLSTIFSSGDWTFRA